MVDPTEWQCPNGGEATYVGGGAGCDLCPGSEVARYRCTCQDRRHLVPTGAEAL